jgi:hypothetical protein
MLSDDGGITAWLIGAWREAIIKALHVSKSLI